MEIYLLGPLEVYRRGVLVTPSAPKLRTVLSLLAIQANTVVRTDQIIDELWEDDPPASVTTTLQTYIYQLRKLLQLATVPGLPERTSSEQPAIRTSAHGYALTMDPDMLDVTRFERLADQGRRELDAGQVEQASRTLVLALRSWRGQVLVDVDQGPVLRTEAVRLEEIRRSALERRIDADLLLGRHHELLGELTRLAAQQPTHEGFQAKLMLALYRAGRRCEALTVYQRTRTTLAMELGLDPSPELERLHRAVLAGDAVLDLPQPRTTARATAPHRPRQLPPEGPPLVGRRSQLTAVLAALTKQRRQRPPVVVVTGPPGSGKSALCVRAGHRAERAYPDGQLYARLLDARGRPAAPVDVLAEFLRALDVPEDRIPPSLNERSRLFRTCTADLRVLVALDDLVSTEQLQPLLPSNPACGVVATARRRLSAPGITAVVALRPLRFTEGAQLLTDVLGAGRVSGEEAAVRELVRICGGLPAALHATAARLQVRPHWRPGKLVEWLADGTALPAEGAALPGPYGQDALSLAASVQRSYLIVSPAARAAFRTLASLEHPAFSLRTAAHALHLSEREAEALLDELAEFQLLEAEPAAGADGLRYRFLEGIRRVGRHLPAEEIGGDAWCAAPDCEALRVEPV